MALKRIMPCLLLDRGGLVKTIKFKHSTYVGDPINAIRIFNEKGVDELVMLDISASRDHLKPNFNLLQDCASECFMPFAYGGGVSSLEDFARLFRLGVEKVIINTLSYRNPSVVRQAVAEYGSTSVVACVDYKKGLFGRSRLYNSVRERSSRTIAQHCRFLAEDIGVGEILLQSVDRDGTWAGYDLETIRNVASAVSIPVIAAGGAGSLDHIQQVLYETHANAAAIGSMAVFQKKGMGVLISFPLRDLIIDQEKERQAALHS